MKILIKKNVHCDYANLKKYLPAQYVLLVPKCYYDDTANFVVFSVKNAATSNDVLKAQKKIGDTEIKTFYFPAVLPVRRKL